MTIWTLIIKQNVCMLCTIILHNMTMLINTSKCGDQMRKDGISESMIQALYYDIVGKRSHDKGFYYGIRDAILSHLVTMHQASGA